MQSRDTFGDSKPLCSERAHMCPAHTLSPCLPPSLPLPLYTLSHMPTTPSRPSPECDILQSESMSSSSTSSTPCSFECRSGSLMRVCESQATFCCLDSRISFLRTRLPWARTAFSTFGWTNRFLCLLCIHPSILHIWSHVETLVMTDHNFFANHVRLSKKPVTFHP